ncbi:hypothetical protein TNCV_981611 [Trichonephila clavipes]|nr:hypothetical protein TNCV_981611 [Trichonephila clavipes]
MVCRRAFIPVWCCLIYAKSLFEELEISFEPPRRIKGSIYLVFCYRPKVISSMDYLNVDQAPQDINKEEFQLERIRLQVPQLQQTQTVKRTH